MLRLLLLLATCAGAVESPKFPPSSEEAHGLPGPERAVALHVLASHHRALLEAFDLTLEGVDWKDPSKPARCELKVEISTASWPARLFVDGLPVRYAQPAVFNEFQRSLTEGIARCSSTKAMAFTSRTWGQLREAWLGLMLRSSGTTYCRKDDDCFAYAISDPCGGRPPVVMLASQTTDIYPYMFRKFAPPVYMNVQQSIAGAVGTLGAAHPDAAVIGPGKDFRCAIPFWKDEAAAAACVEHACRAR